eukprot:TRINITY_DN668_c0_g1_i2.p1 TRINITY_DN668_c0_g1~~TRINITY_DN668_c0_g1_i2.p1  ORF type:complete len:224 (-),score=-0.00 TRINITY_DN668_c0_g1_i2:162-833(-)
MIGIELPVSCLNHAIVFEGCKVRISRYGSSLLDEEESLVPRNGNLPDEEAHSSAPAEKALIPTDKSNGENTDCTSCCVCSMSQRTKAVLSAVTVGIPISCYSIVDSIGVKLWDPISYNTALFTVIFLIASPIILWRFSSQVTETFEEHKVATFVIGTNMAAVYLMVLYAFQLADAGYVVALRELSVVIGSLLGVFFLKERLTIQKGFGILCVIVGIVVIKTIV